ncbi:MAG: hypothetical protein ACOVO1_10720 [Chitinophagaceae bacterium]
MINIEWNINNTFATARMFNTYRFFPLAKKLRNIKIGARNI